jgi:hypothetical protein
MKEAQPRLLARTLGNSFPSFAEEGFVIRRSRKSRYAREVPPTEPMNPHNPKSAPLYTPAPMRCCKVYEPSANTFAGSKASFAMSGLVAVEARTVGARSHVKIKLSASPDKTIFRFFYSLLPSKVRMLTDCTVSQKEIKLFE